MIGNASSRRAEEFHEALSGGASSDVVERYAELVGLVSAMRSAPEPHARPEFVADLRSRLLLAAEAQPVRRTDDATALRLTPKQRRGSRERRIAALLGGFAVVAASGSMAVASQSALPGDVLYPVKRAIENAHANLESSSQGKADVLLDNANTRLREVEQLSQRQSSSDADAAEISTTLQSFKEQTSQASALAISDFSDHGDDKALNQVRDFATSSMDRLSALDDVLPSGARPALVAAAQTVRQVDQAAYSACPTCSSSQIVQLPDLVTQPLSSALSGSVPHTTGKATKHTKAPSKPKATHSGAPTTPPPASSGDGDNTKPKSGITIPPVLPSDTPSKTGGLITGTVDKLTKTLLGDGSKSGSDDSGSDGQSNPGLVQGLTGLLGLN